MEINEGFSSFGRIGSMILAVAVVFVAGCDGESAASRTPSMEKIVALENDMAKLRQEVQQLRHRIEMEDKMRSRFPISQVSHRPDRPGALAPQDFRKEEFRARHSAMREGSAAVREDPAKMTPEQRRAWHEERRRMREELSKMTPEQRRAWYEEQRRMRKAHGGREKISEPGKQAGPDKENKTNPNKGNKGENK